MKELIAHKLVSQKWSKAKKTGVPKIDKHTFYASDAEVLKYLVRLAGCPSGQIVPSEHLGIDFDVPVASHN